MAMAAQLITVLLVAVSLSHMASSLTLFDVDVYLSNISNETLTASCRANGRDVGTFTIPAVSGKDFRVDVLVKERSVATCSLRLGQLSGTFDVFDWGRDKNRCANRVCSWRIVQSGVYLLINNLYTLVFTWP